jgi:ubiquinol-cytochrome c reductase cytochrome c1 subunit
MKKFILTLFSVSAVMGASPAAFAAEGGTAPEHQHWHFDGPFGQYDKAALQRGFLVYRQVCSACHSMDKLSYRNLEGIGYDDSQVKAIAQEYTVIDGPNDEGEMFERPAIPSDRFVSPFPNEQAAKASNGGAMPPDLSLIAHARHGGADYVYSLLAKGYVEPHGDVTLLPGQYYNEYMAGHVIAMAPPLSDGLVAYPDGSPERVEQYAKDVAEFLQWAADPHMEARKSAGLSVMIFLAMFSLVFFLAKKKVWKNVKKK